MKETWIKLDEYPGYKFSNKGRVISYKSDKPKFIAESSNYNNGYISLSLQDKNKKTKCFLKHRFIAKLFLPNPHNKPDINHIDGDKSNNSVDNLEWVTKSENTQHAVDNGFLKVRGENNHGSLLTEEKVRNIRNEFIPRKVTIKYLAKKYGVKPVTISSVIHRTSWKWVS